MSRPTHFDGGGFWLENGFQGRVVMSDHVLTFGGLK
jgi:hypothetical protein